MSPLEATGATWQPGDRVLTPDFSAGTVEEVDGEMVGVRLDSWAGLGVPSCCVTWGWHRTFKPLPAGYVPEVHSIADWQRAHEFVATVEAALEGL